MVTAGSGEEDLQSLYGEDSDGFTTSVDLILLDVMTPVGVVRGSETVWLAEDEPLVRTMIPDTLSGHGLDGAGSFRWARGYKRSPRKRYPKYTSLPT